MTATIKTLSDAPALTLSNGLRVANFSSPHPFNFVDGSVLPAVDVERCSALSMGREKDVVVPWPNALHAVNAEIVAVTPVFTLTPAVEAALEELQESWDVDIVMVPFPLLQLLRDQNLLARFNKCATVIMEDRVTKAASITKFGR